MIHARSRGVTSSYRNFLRTYERAGRGGLEQCPCPLSLIVRTPKLKFQPRSLPTHTSASFTKDYALELGRRGAAVVVNDLGGGMKGEAAGAAAGARVADIVVQQIQQVRAPPAGTDLKLMAFELSALRFRIEYCPSLLRSMSFWVHRFSLFTVLEYSQRCPGYMWLTTAAA